jgi:serine/threonine protein kinase
MIGQIVGNYKILEKIGEGGMGSVYKGVDLMLEREVAIKALRPELGSQPEVVERFRSEAVTLARLDHPNIARLYSFLRQGDEFFMVLEFVRGQTLDKVIVARGAMPCGEALPLFCQVLNGVDHAHTLGIVHRDIKPANMMLTERGSIKVMDFGIARVLGTDRLTKVGRLIGTIEYMSPEQIRGEETDTRSDIYALGILLYEILTGRVPFSSPSEYELMRSQVEDTPLPPREFAPQTPLGVEEAVMRALAKKREERFSTADEFRLALLTSQAVPSRSSLPTLSSAPITSVIGQTIEPHLQHIKETGPAVASVAAPTVKQIKETRLASGDEPQAIYTSTASPSAGPKLMHAPSFFHKLDWRHYAGAVAVLLVLIAATFAFISRTRKETVGRPAVNEPDLRQSAASNNKPPLTADPPFTPLSEQQTSNANSSHRQSRSGSVRSNKPSQPQLSSARTLPGAPAKASDRPVSSKEDAAKSAQRKESPSPPKAENTPPSKPAVKASPATSSKAETDKNSGRKGKKRGFFGKLKKLVDTVTPGKKP